MVQHHGSFMGASNSNSYAAPLSEADARLDAEFERLRKIELSYLTLFRKSSRFDSAGFGHFFLSQELKFDGFANNVMNSMHQHPQQPQHRQTSLDGSLDPPSESHSMLNDIASGHGNGNGNDLRRNKSTMTVNTVKSTGGLSSISMESHAIYNLAFSHDGKYLASAGADGLIRVWEVIASELDRQDFHTHNTDLASSSVATVPQRHRRSFIDTAFDETLSDITSILNVTANEMGSRSMSRSMSKPPVLQLSPTQAQPPLLHPPKGRSRRNTLNSNDSMSSDAHNTFGVTNGTGTTDKDGDKSSIYAPVFKSDPVKIFYHDKTVNSLDWSKNNFLLSSSEDGTAKLWHVDRADCLQTYRFDSIVTAAQFHKSDDRFFVASQWNGRVVFLSILEKEIIFEIKLNKSITCLDFSPDSKKLFVGCDKGYVFSLKINHHSFEIEDDYQLKKKKTGHRITGIKSFVDESTKSGNVNYVPNPNGGSAATASKNAPNDDGCAIKLLITSNDSKCRLVNYSHKFLEVKYTGYTNKFSSIAASLNEDHTFLITGSEDGWTYMWQIYSDKKKKIENEKKVLNKAHFDILNFFKDDTSIIENKYYGSFHTNNSRCNVSIFAPRASLKLLELSNDPIFDLKHQYSFALKESGVKDTEVDDLTTAIIVTADNMGKIKVFRRDFARPIRKALQTKKMAHLVERRRATLREHNKQNPNNGNTLSTIMDDQTVMNRNALVIPNYEATRMNIADTMKSVYLEPPQANTFRGRSSRGGTGKKLAVMRPANKLAVETAAIPTDNNVVVNGTGQGSLLPLSPSSSLSLANSPAPSSSRGEYFSSFSPSPTGHRTSASALSGMTAVSRSSPQTGAAPAEIEQQLRVLLGPSGSAQTPGSAAVAQQVAQHQHSRSRSPQKT